MLPVTLDNIIGGGFFGLVYWYSTYAPNLAQIPDGVDGGMPVRLTDSSQKVVPGGLVVIGEDENENEIYGKLPSQS